MRWPWIAISLCGCVAKPPVGPSGDPADTDPIEVSDTDPPADTDDSDNPETACPYDTPADVIVEISTACGPPAEPLSVDLVDVWTDPYGHALRVHAGRSRDTDGDGAVTAADSLQAWIQSGWDGYAVVAADRTSTFSEVLDAIQLKGILADLDPAAPEPRWW